MDVSSGQKISKDIVELNNSTHHLDIMNIYRQLHPATAKCSFFSSSYGILTKTEHILVHKIYSSESKQIKSYNVCSQTTVELNFKSITKDNWKILRFLKIKEHLIK